MNDDLDQLRADWEAQPVHPPRFTPEQLQANAARLDAVIFSRNRREYAAAVLVFASFGALSIAIPHPVSQVGSAWIAAAALWISWNLYRRGTPAELFATDGRTWLIQELTRERDLLSGVWRWYLGPLVPGFALFLAGPLLGSPSGVQVASIAVTGVVGAVVFAWIGRLNAQAASELDRELSEVVDG